METSHLWESQGQRIGISRYHEIRKWRVVLSVNDGSEERTVASREYKGIGAAKRMAEQWMAFSEREWKIIK